MTVASVVTAVLATGCAQTAMGPMRGEGMHGGQVLHDRRQDVAAPASSPRPGAPEVVVIAADFSFEPATIEVASDSQFNITLDNRGRVYHDLTIEELSFVLAADVGDRASGTLEVGAPGRYEIVCTVLGHAAAGMTGILIATG